MDAPPLAWYEPTDISVKPDERILRPGALKHIDVVHQNLGAEKAFDLIVTVALGSTLASILTSKDVALAQGILAFSVLIGLQFAIAANRNNSFGVVLLLGMTFLLGWWLGPLLTAALSLRNGPQLVGFAAAGTGAIFFIMAGIATTTKRDFSFMGKFLFVGMIVLLIAMIANLFLQIPALALTISALVIVVFSLFLLF